jgi:hypothetical protein
MIAVPATGHSGKGWGDGGEPVPLGVPVNSCGRRSIQDRSQTRINPNAETVPNFPLMNLHLKRNAALGSVRFDRQNSPQTSFCCHIVMST